MKLVHRNITSSLFELIGTYEIDIDLGNEIDREQFSLRIELFRSLTEKKLFRYKTWKNELFRVQSTFPQDNSGVFKHEPSDEMILVGFSQKHFGPVNEFNAENSEAALHKIIEDLGKALEHITSEKIKVT